MKKVIICLIAVFGMYFMVHGMDIEDDTMKPPLSYFELSLQHANLKDENDWLKEQVAHLYTRERASKQRTTRTLGRLSEDVRTAEELAATRLALTGALLSMLHVANTKNVDLTTTCAWLIEQNSIVNRKIAEEKARSRSLWLALERTSQENAQLKEGLQQAQQQKKGKKRKFKEQ